MRYVAVKKAIPSPKTALFHKFLFMYSMNYYSLSKILEIILGELRRCCASLSWIRCNNNDQRNIIVIDAWFGLWIPWVGMTISKFMQKKKKIENNNLSHHSVIVNKCRKILFSLLVCCVGIEIDWSVWLIRMSNVSLLRFARVTPSPIWNCVTILFDFANAVCTHIECHHHIHHIEPFCENVQKTPFRCIEWCESKTLLSYSRC